MKELNFSIYNSDTQVTIIGGDLHDAPQIDNNRVVEYQERQKKLSIYIHENSSFLDFQQDIYNLIKSKFTFVYILFLIRKRLPSLLLLLPISMTVTFLALVTVWGDFVIMFV